jgi:flagellin-like hook-associated protein FlgL
MASMSSDGSSKNAILLQAAQAMLAQADQIPVGVLRLLG